MNDKEIQSALTMITLTIGNYPPRIQKKMITRLEEGFSIDLENLPSNIYEEAEIDREKLLQAIEERRTSDV